MSTRLRGRVWMSKDLVVIRGLPYNVMDVQNFVGAHRVRGGVVAVHDLWPELPETWESSHILGAQNFVGACGDTWICLDANESCVRMDRHGRATMTLAWMPTICMSVRPFCDGGW